MSTRQSIRAWCYDILREYEEDSKAYPITLINDFINNYYFDALTIWVLNLFTNEMIKPLSLPFTEEIAYFDIKNKKTLNNELNIWDTSIQIDTEWLLSAWKVIISWNIITYTSKTSSALEWVSWIKWNFKSWTIVEQLYDLPSDYYSPIELTNNWSPINLVNYNDISKVYNEKYQASNSYVTIIQWKYLLISLWNTGTNLVFKYKKKPTLLTNDTDEIIIPDDTYSMFIKYLAVWEMMFNRWEEWKWKEVFLFWLTKLKQMYEFYNNQSMLDLHWTKIKTWKINPYNF